MSRQSHLPPRCPFQKKPFVYRCQESSPQHPKYASQSAILEDQPSWLEDLLSDQDGESSRTPLRRATSDTAAMLGVIEEENASWTSYLDEGISPGYEVCGNPESTSMYGPNSPRHRSFVALSDNPLASALSEYAFQTTMQTADGSFCMQASSYSDSMHPSGETISDAKLQKRHSGQRSRVRKLQYIAELERTVETLQTIESELAVNVASMLQKRVSLSLENTKLKQNIARLRQEKSLMEGQYKVMKKELERLKIGLPNTATRQHHHRSGSAAETSRQNMNWTMLDMAKLNLN